MPTLLLAASGGGGGGSGSVTSVGLSLPGIFTVTGSPVTTAGTISVSLATQVKNTLFCGPSTGADAAPTFRSLVVADLPTSGVTPGSYTAANITVDAYGRITTAANGGGGAGVTSVNGRNGVVTLIGTDLPVFVGSGASHAVGAVPDPGAGAGTTKFLREDATWAVPPGGGGGGVTSVAMTVPSFLAVAGTPITTTGTLAVTLATQVKNTVFTGPASGADAAPTFRTLVAADLITATYDRVTFSDAPVTVSKLNYVVVAQTGTLTASRAVTFPLAATAGAGARILVIDESGTATGTNTLVVTRAGSDTINGATTYTMGKAYQGAMFVSDGTSKWTLSTPDQLPTLVSSKWLTNNGTTTSWGTITTSDVSGLGGMATQNGSAVAITGGAIDGTPIGATTRSTGKFTTINMLAAAGSTAVTVDGGTQTTSFPAVSIIQTWNAGAVTFTGFVINITSTASAAGSLIQDWQVAGATVANMTKAGTLVLAANLTMTTGTASVAALAQVFTNTAVSGTFTAHVTATESANPAGSSSAQYVGVMATCKSLAANAQSFTDATSGITGVYGIATHAGTGTITAVSGGIFTLSTTNASGTITTGYGVQVIGFTKAGGTTITNAYGVFIADVTVGGTNWALKTGLGLVEFGDLVKVKSYTVAGLPAGSTACLAWASDGRKNGEGAGSGTGVLAFKDGTAWRACDTGATVAA